MWSQEGNAGTTSSGSPHAGTSLNLCLVNLVRSLERRLERLLEGVVGRAFSGRLHPSEIAGRLAREADFALFDHPAGQATANAFSLTFNPADLHGDKEELQGLLAREMTDYAANQGLRLEGPVSVSIGSDESVPTGQFTCHVEVVPGPPVTWARLVSNAESYPIGRNRVIIGRSPEVDVIVDFDDVSRSHAALWREGGVTSVRDLGSSNGTFVDGVRIGADPVVIEHGSTLGISEHSYRFLNSDA